MTPAELHAQIDRLAERARINDSLTLFGVNKPLTITVRVYDYAVQIPAEQIVVLIRARLAELEGDLKEGGIDYVAGDKAAQEANAAFGRP